MASVGVCSIPWWRWTVGMHDASVHQTIEKSIESSSPLVYAVITIIFSKRDAIKPIITRTVIEACNNLSSERVLIGRAVSFVTISWSSLQVVGMRLGGPSNYHSRRLAIVAGYGTHHGPYSEPANLPCSTYSVAIWTIWNIRYLWGRARPRANLV